MKPNRGWLANPERRARQTRSLAFKPSDVQGLLDQITNVPSYISRYLGKSVLASDLKLERKSS